jgi:hypothetical protein
MQRRPTTQDLTWLLDQHQNKQLNLNPPYQRRSVWTLRDKQFFLDTIFRNYPSPAIFLHKTINESGKATYHVVDGKQRTQTILDFVNDQIRIAKDFGDVRLDGKRWSELQGEQDLKQRFWNYQITVEMIDFVEGRIVNEVFDRLNRNARRLVPQELRHAKFEGWLISAVEAESSRDEWRGLGVATPARSRRMVDSQFISELMLVILERKISGFDQDVLDELYAKYEEPEETAPELNEEAFQQRFAATKTYLLDMEKQDQAVSRYAKGFGNFYTLWSIVALAGDLAAPTEFAQRYIAFMQKVDELAAQPDLDAFLRDKEAGAYALPLTYLTHSRGASTDLGPRMERFTALKNATLGQ